MNEETYCMPDPTDNENKSYYICKDKINISDKFRFNEKSKFPKKYMVWQVMDSLGNISKLFVFKPPMTVELYLNQYIKKGLLPFINGRDVLFWSDMARCHYAKKVVTYFDEKTYIM